MAVHDLVIKNARIYDGSGAAAFLGNVAVDGSKITYVGPNDPGDAKRCVDAKGLSLAPGFIDVHADFMNPFQLNEGIHQVYVAGQLTLEDNKPTGQWCGKYLTRK